MENLKAVDQLINKLRFTGLAYLMDKEYGKYSKAEQLKHAQRLALELRILTSRIISEAFNEKDFMEQHYDEK